MINPASLRELRQAQLELLGWRFRVYPFHDGLTWNVTASKYGTDISHQVERAIRSQAIEEALTWATVEELNIEERRDTIPAPPAEVNRAAAE